MVDSTVYLAHPGQLLGLKRSRALPSARATVLAALMLMFVANTANGGTPQQQDEVECGFLCDIGSDFKTFGTSSRTALVLGPALGLSLLSKNFDDDVSRSRINSELYPGGVLDGLLEPGELGGGSAMQYGVAFATLAIGKVSGKDPLADLGSALVRAQLLNSAVTSAFKYTIRRTRPDGVGRTSFPSGHTSGSFATATILQRRFGWKIGAPGFAFASLVGASRLSENRHHLSDVVFGAAIGLASGLSVRIGDRSLPFQVTPEFVSGGMGVRVSRSLAH